jgi:hypothetical protein
MDDQSLEVPATEYDGTTSDSFVPTEMEAGFVRDDLSVEHLAWELLVPVAYVRLLYLHGKATEEQRRAGRRRGCTGSCSPRTSSSPSDGWASCSPSSSWGSVP